MQESTTVKTKRELITELLSRLHPDRDLNDEATLFDLIYADYEEYARYIERREADIQQAKTEGEIEGRNARIEEIVNDAPVTDGVPCLGGCNTTYRPTSASIFDIARNI